MEHFRRLGIADAIYDAAVAADSPLDVSWISRLSEWELCRFRYPSITQQRKSIGENNDGTQAAEPQIRISQIIVEPVLKQALEAKPEVEVRFGWGLQSFVQDADGVTAIIKETATGKQEQVRCQYLAGCDGGSSTTRKQLGIEWEGAAKAVAAFMIHFRSRDYELLQKFGLAWHYQSPVHGTLICQDDIEYWTLHVICPPGADSNEFDAREKLFDFAGEEFHCEILRANPYYGHMLVAQRYGRDRVWLAGDAAHQYFPTGGYGMNTGVVDAASLGWTLAAQTQGWGGPQLFTAYEHERRPVAVRNRGWSYEHVSVRAQIAEAYTPSIHEDTQAGARARTEIGKHILALKNMENECWGVQHGYRYADSPIICDDTDTPPEFDPLSYKPTTWPGMRPPHVFLDDGTPIFELFGPGFTLMRFADHDISGFESAAQQTGLPLKIVDIREPKARELWQRDLVLVRPDMMVAWRGNAAPDNPLEIIDTVRGDG